MTTEKFNPEIDNPCWGCEYRKSGEPDYINKCLLELDGNKNCVRDKPEGEVEEE